MWRPSSCWPTWWRSSGIPIACCRSLRSLSARLCWALWRTWLMPEFTNRDPRTAEFWDQRFEAEFMPWDRGGVPAQLARWLKTGTPVSDPQGLTLARDRRVLVSDPGGLTPG